MSVARTFAGTLLGLSLLAVTTDGATARDDYPLRPITLIVPFAAGGPAAQDQLLNEVELVDI